MIIGNLIIGCIIETIVLYIAFSVGEKEKSVNKFLLISIIGVLIIILLFNVYAGIGGIGACIFFIKYIMRESEQREKNIKKNDSNGIESLYINHCWNCKHPIDSRINKKCIKCGKHYICPKCGKCYCDYYK